MSGSNTPFFVKGVDASQQTYEARLAFAKDAYERCSRFAQMVEKARK